MRGETDYNIFTDIIKILRGETNILDLTEHTFINKLTDKNNTINYYYLLKFQSEQGSEEFGSRWRGVQSQVFHLGLELGVAGEKRRQEGE